MVLKTELCRFSGGKIYPGKGIRFVLADSQVLSQQIEAFKADLDYHVQETTQEDIAHEAVKKRRCTIKKPYSRSIVGATLEVIQKKRTEKSEVRDAAREAALREIKERIKKIKDEKEAEVMAKTQKAHGKGNVPKGAGPKDPKLRS